MPTPEMNLGAEVKRALDEALRARGRANIVVAGRSGVGKSTLINAVFQGKMAETGQGRPVTRSTREISKEGIPVSLFDTKGLEMASYQETLAEVERLVVERGSDPDPTRHLHAAWVCVSEESRRVEEGESALVRLLARHMPVIVVITKAQGDGGFLAVVRDLVPEARNVLRVNSIPTELDEGLIVPVRGLKELVALTMEVVPEGQRNAFAAAQKVDVEVKKTRARILVGSAATMAATIGASPIPFPDALVLVPLQISMLAGITSVFGVPLAEGFLSALVGSVATGGGATMVGRSLVTMLLKLFPGAGTVLGGAIAAGTAAALTTGFGEAYIRALAGLFLENGGEPPSPEQVTERFRKEFTRKEDA